jgi:hypothetical protein
MFRLEIIKIKKPNLKSSISKNIQFKICSNSKNSNKKMFESEKCSNLKNVQIWKGLNVKKSKFEKVHVLKKFVLKNV